MTTKLTTKANNIVKAYAMKTCTTILSYRHACHRYRQTITTITIAVVRTHNYEWHKSVATAIVTTFNYFVTIANTIDGSELPQLAMLLGSLCGHQIANSSATVLCPMQDRQDIVGYFG
eukprot:scaffold426685_cov22-Prasinocladus_malaysianus.AAC.1